MVKERLKRIVSLYVCRYKNDHDFFIANNRTVDLSVSDGRQMYVALNESEYNGLCAEFDFSVSDADIKKRFENNDKFCLLADSQGWGCWGWIADSKREFYVLEIDSYSVIPENAQVLYHFFTNEKRRRQGFYCDLLKMISSNSNKDYSVIYAYGFNTASTGAIKKAGFTFAGRMSHKTFCGFENIIRSFNENKRSCHND